MRNKYIITKEEYEAIKEAVSEVLQLWNYDYISASGGNDGRISI